jgi:hypothetical protein
MTRPGSTARSAYVPSGGWSKAVCSRTRAGADASTSFGVSDEGSEEPAVDQAVGDRRPVHRRALQPATPKSSQRREVHLPGARRYGRLHSRSDQGCWAASGSGRKPGPLSGIPAACLLVASLDPDPDRLRSACGGRDSLLEMTRVLITGMSGTGKSTTARLTTPSTT